MDVIEEIRTGKIDCNRKELFFAALIRGVILSLNQTIQTNGKYIRHLILHTGDDLMYLNNKGQDASVEPLEISNEDYIYSVLPRCILNPGSISIISDQTTNPHVRGYFQMDLNDKIYTLSAEFRRIPIKLNVELKYYLNSFHELLDVTQQIISKLSFIRTFSITYMGQIIKCSYRIPDDFQGEHLTELDGTTMDNKFKTLSLSIEVESNLPVYENRTVVDANNVIKGVKTNTKL